MTYAQSILLGALQGLGEFLPISSSAHLVLAPWLLRFDDPGLSFDVALHLGTLVAIAAVYASRWASILKDAALEPRGAGGRKLGLLALATIPGAVAGVLLEKAADHAFRSPALVAVNLIVFGFIMLWAEAIGEKTAGWIESTFGKAGAIGAAQALALAPGVSRSGATMTAGLFLGMTRESAAEFSFLLSAPIIAGAAVLKLHHLSGADITGPFLCGIAVSALTGWFAIRAFLRRIGQSGLKPFAYYRFVLGAVVLAVYFIRG